MVINRYVGIDPGVNGAIALIYGDKVQFWDPPTYQTEYKRLGKVRKRTHYNVSTLAWLLAMECQGDTKVILEEVTSRPGDGVVQAFSFGYGFGLYCGILASLKSDRNITLVRPATWKRSLGLLKQDKEASRQLALSLYPQAEEFLSRKKDSDRAEALLLAHYLKILDQEGDSVAKKQTGRRQRSRVAKQASGSVT